MPLHIKKLTYSQVKFTFYFYLFIHILSLVPYCLSPRQHANHLIEFVLNSFLIYIYICIYIILYIPQEKRLFLISQFLALIRLEPDRF